MADTLQDCLVDTNRYVVAATVSDHSVSSMACAALEAREVPVLIDHIHVQDRQVQGRQRLGLQADGVAFRVLVPAHFSQSALRVLAGLGIMPDLDFLASLGAANQDAASSEHDFKSQYAA